MKIVKNEKSYSSQHRNRPAYLKKQPYSLQIKSKKELLQGFTTSQSLHYLYPLNQSYQSPQRQNKTSRQTNKQIYMHKNVNNQQQQTKKKVKIVNSINQNLTPKQFNQNTLNNDIAKILQVLSHSINNLSNQIQNISNEVYKSKSIQTQLANISQKVSSISSNKDKFMNYNDYRYEQLQINIPKIPIIGQSRKYIIQQSLGNACKHIFSIGFGLLYRQQMQISKVKVFCSEKLMSWLIKLIKTNFLTVSEISHIDRCLAQKILPYFSAKYPASNQIGQNYQLSSLIVERKNIQENQNNLLMRQQINFRLKQSGNYDMEIMGFMNRILSLINQKKQYQGLYSQEKTKKMTLFNRFQEDITCLFQKVQSKEDVQEMQNYQVNKTIFEEDIMSLIKRGSYQEYDNLRGTCRRSTFMNIDTKIKQDTHQMQIIQNPEEYRQNVKTYTKFQINKKISDNIRPFTHKQILTGDFSLIDIGMIRLLIKWTQQLYSCFDKKATLERQHPFHMKDQSQSFLQKRWSLILYKLLQKEKSQIEQYKNKIQKHAYETQLSAANKQVSPNLKAFTSEESKIGQFSILMFKNGQAYLKGYLNTLIHSICTALYKFQNIMKFKECLDLQNLQLKQIEDLNIQSLYEKTIQYLQNGESVESMIPQLITFTVGDIFRSKCSSKQKQITALYKQIQKISQQKPHIFKIARVKNKLKEGTKDILINLLYREKLLVQIQLAVKNQKTKIIDKQYEFKHYLYEIERGMFGPIHQLCNTWASKDPRASFYFTNFQKQNKRRNTNDIHICLHPDKTNINLPFECSCCSYYYTDPKSLNNHLECNIPQCKSKRICFLCQYQKSYSQKVSNSAIIHSILAKTLQKDIFYYRKEDQEILIKNFPFKGYIISLNRQSQQKNPFVKIQFQKKIYLLEPKNESSQYKILKEIDIGQGYAQIRRFLCENIIISDTPPQFQKYKNDQQIIQKAESTFFIPKYFRSCIKNQKSAITLSRKNLQNDKVFVCKSGDFRFVKSLNLSYNKISSIDNIASKFSNVQILNLSNNLISTLPKDLTNFALLTKLQLNHNRSLKQVPQQIFLSPSLQSIQLKQCSITCLNLPKNSCHYSRLKSLRVDNNNLVSISDNIEVLQHLQTLTVSNNSLKTLTSSIKNLKFLKHLDISKNQGLTLPQFLGQLTYLERLEASHNQLFVFPQKLSQLSNLKVLNLSYNKFKNISQAFLKLQSLEKFNISSNDLQNIPKQISKLQKLKQLNLQKNIRLTHIPQQIGQLKELRILKITKKINQFEQLRIPRSIIEQTINNLPSLRQRIDDEKKTKNEQNQGWQIRINKPSQTQ